MLGQRKRGRLVTFEVVAAIASVEVRRSRKLPSVLVCVAFGAAIKLDLEERGFTLRNVALSTL